MLWMFILGMIGDQPQTCYSTALVIITLCLHITQMAFKIKWATVFYLCSSGNRYNNHNIDKLEKSFCMCCVYSR